MDNNNQLENFFASPQDPQKDPQNAWSRFKNFWPTKHQLLHLPKVLTTKERYIALVLLLVAFGALIAIPVRAYYHYTHPVADHGGSFTEGIIGAPRTINPILAPNNSPENDIINLVYAGLMRYDGQGNLSPDLAQAVELGQDGVTYTVVLRPNLMWHDGVALTADDVVFTIRAVQNPDYQSPLRLNWQGVDAKKIDDHTLTLTLRNPYAQFLNNMTLGIMPKHIWQDVASANFATDERNFNPIGAGPYRADDIDQDATNAITSVTLKSYDQYHHQKPYISKITLVFYEDARDLISHYNSGRLQAASITNPIYALDINQSDRAHMHRINQTRYFSIFFNQETNEALSQRSIRQALNHGTNKEQIVENVMGGYANVIDSPLLPGILAIPDATVRYSYDRDKAVTLFEEDGWILTEGSDIRQQDADDDPAPLKIKLTTLNALELPLVAQEIAKQWSTLGVDVEIETVPIAEIRDLIQKRDYEALLFGEVLTIDPDPFSFWHSSQTQDPGLNIALYDRNASDTLLEKGRAELDDQARLALYDELQNQILEQAPAVFIYSPQYIYMQSTNIHGTDLAITSVPAHRFDMVHQWYIDTQRVRQKE